jgi:hypothetical protein
MSPALLAAGVGIFRFLQGRSCRFFAGGATFDAFIASDAFVEALPSAIPAPPTAPSALVDPVPAFAPAFSPPRGPAFPSGPTFGLNVDFATLFLIEQSSRVTQNNRRNEQRLTRVSEPKNVVRELDQRMSVSSTARRWRIRRYVATCRARQWAFPCCLLPVNCRLLHRSANGSALTG